VEWIARLKRGDSKGKLQASELETLQTLTGWWTSINAGDFDNDGRLDLVVGNWGRNNFQRQFLDAPLHLYSGDPDGSGNLGLIEAHHDSGVGKIVPARDWMTLSAVFPALRDRFSSFTAFSRAGIEDILTAGSPPLREVAAVTLDSMVLLNRGDHFEVRALPVEAQFAPVFGLAVADFDGDGGQDIFLGQNFFGVSAAESRQDAGCGLWLRGDGSGNFSAVTAAESGFALFGEARGAALSDFDQDGRIDLAVALNRGPTQLYRNVRAQPGLRVRLTGGPQNSQAIGVKVRGAFPDGGLGPAHELRLGGGYWSQDSADLILSTAKPLAALEIRWPGGMIERMPLPSGAREFTRQQPAAGADK
jgi:hypothetical protein